MDDGKHVEISTLGAKQEGGFGGEDGVGRFGKLVDSGKHASRVIEGG